MWKNLYTGIVPLIKNSLILKPESILQQQLRTTFILKRRTSPYLNKIGSKPKRLRNRHYIYDLVEDTNMVKRPDMDVILTTYVEGVGNMGDKVSVRPNFAYNKLLVPGLAIYASPENVEKYKHIERKESEVHSSATSQRTVNLLSRMTLSVNMNKDNEWTLQPWHIKANFRKSGYHVPEEAITMHNKPIKGPNMDLEGKEFYVTVTINNLEKVNVRCRLHHWATDTVDRIPYEHEFWKKKGEAIFAEDEEILSQLPSNPTLQKDS